MPGAQNRFQCRYCRVALQPAEDQQLYSSYLNAGFRNFNLSMFQCPNCGFVELYNEETLDRFLKDQSEAVPAPDTNSEQEVKLASLGILPGGEDLPPEDPAVAQMYEEDADEFRSSDDEGDLPIG